jgi:hydrogenase maturation protein HypF
MLRYRIKIEGIVQGVGFRPFVHLLAEKHSLKGWVLNSPSGVLIEVEGEQPERFLEELKNNPPLLAVIERVKVEELEPAGYPQFEIRASQVEEEPIALIPPDVATCPDCMREMQNPADRRYHYPFLNCTNCGPRFTIIERLPYDRPNTSMKAFALCPDCALEYSDIHQRRYHAQPIACPRCGPLLELIEINTQNCLGGTIISHPLYGEKALQQAHDLLFQGKILAVKGLGGFHLACDATNEQAVQTLRHRKGRPHKSLAVMCPSIGEAEKHVDLVPEDKRLLESWQRPILLLPRKENSALAPSISPDNHQIGVMLPYTPLHTLLLERFSALVMTSANESQEPIVSSNEDAAIRLRPVADAVLQHDRPIAQRLDDSVIAPGGSGLQFIRRARGYAPTPFRLWREFPPLLAVGPELKNTFALSTRNLLLLSHHIGDLVNYETLQHFQQSTEHLMKLYRIQPEVVAYDLHPNYLTTRYALSLSLSRKIAVQHHHAHIASVLFEHGEQGQVIGVACDGTGYGEDGAIWGMEWLVASLRSVQRAGHLSYAPMPGGEEAILHPWRMAVGHLMTAYGTDALPLLARLFPDRSDSEWFTIQRQIEVRFNTPLTSSAGRLFDTVAVILGFPAEISYEGRAAVLLQKAAQETTQGPVLDFPLEGEDPFVFNPALLLKMIAERKLAGQDPCELAFSFHRAVATAIVAGCRHLRETHGLDTVALSGGVFQNCLLLQITETMLTQERFRVLLPRKLPSNDGCVAVGQAAAAFAQLEETCA